MNNYADRAWNGYQKGDEYNYNSPWYDENADYDHRKPDEDEIYERIYENYIRK